MVSTCPYWRVIPQLWICVVVFLLRSLPLCQTLRKSHSSRPVAPQGHGFLSFDRLWRSFDRARVESYVRDVNLQLQQRPGIERLLIVLELGEPFARHCRSADGDRLLLANSDKVSLPESILTQLTDTNAAVPWQFVIQKVHRCQLTNKSDAKGAKLPSTNNDFFSKEDGPKERLSCSSLEFRPQDNFIFMPRWMMESLQLKPYDVVHLSQHKLPDATFVKLAPLETSFFELPSPKSVLEEHLKHYSTLTRGSTIPITHNGVTYHLRVLRIETEEIKDAECASIQDTDVSTDLVRLP
ncbi:ubiquitin fusion degradation protein UFD1, putative [Babesia bigemina]|uniref:Ubiquitin fusion degradation protein UFD1, putative n=1 Tax=Babesia bigemina TaxID=5866 RepID=A0A061D256_BABBI|nr:ubiquitin fusion degradation protein UFD1, putative [Babesia bigemina]CDR94703.1 ubiquitin fusion degradation protein UFD1, putative [Babesia bigemina]|eukprot:XP_012766889.1 ubiquitin fusion degradation protein UFD1, putative [Babesia bigemina]